MSVIICEGIHSEHDNSFRRENAVDVFHHIQFSFIRAGIFRNTPLRGVAHPRAGCRHSKCRSHDVAIDHDNAFVAKVDILQKPHCQVASALKFILKTIGIISQWKDPMRGVDPPV